MGREEEEGLRREGWITFDRIAKTWVSAAYKMQHGSPRTENAGEYSWMTCQYVLRHIVTASTLGIPRSFDQRKHPKGVNLTPPDIFANISQTTTISICMFAEHF